MAKIAIVSSNNMGTACWSAARFTGGCVECSRVERCVLPESSHGRGELYRKRMLSHLDEAKKYENMLNTELTKE